MWGLFPKGARLFHGVSTFMTQVLPGAILIPSHLGAVILAGTTFSPQQMECQVKGLQG